MSSLDNLLKNKYVKRYGRLLVVFLVVTIIALIIGLKKIKTQDNQIASLQSQTNDTSQVSDLQAKVNDLQQQLDDKTSAYSDLRSAVLFDPAHNSDVDNLQIKSHCGSAPTIPSYNQAADPNSLIEKNYTKWSDCIEAIKDTFIDSYVSQYKQ